MQEFMDFFTQNKEAIVAIITAIVTLVGYFSGKGKGQNEGYKQGAKDGAHIAVNTVKNDGAVVVEKTEGNGPNKELVKDEHIKDVENVTNIIVETIAQLDPERAEKIKTAGEEVKKTLEGINKVNKEFHDVKEDLKEKKEDFEKKTSDPNHKGFLKIGTNNGNNLYASDIIEEIQNIKNAEGSVKKLGKNIEKVAKGIGRLFGIR